MLSNPPRRARPEPIINRLAVLACQQPKEPAPADGYSKNWARQLMELAAEVSGWLGEAGLGAGDLTGEVMGEFFARRGPGCSRCRTARSLGVAAAEVVPGPSLRCTSRRCARCCVFCPLPAGSRRRWWTLSPRSRPGRAQSCRRQRGRRSPATRGRLRYGEPKGPPRRRGRVRAAVARFACQRGRSCRVASVGCSVSEGAVWSWFR